MSVCLTLLPVILPLHEVMLDRVSVASSQVDFRCSASSDSGLMKCAVVFAECGPGDAETEQSKHALQGVVTFVSFAMRDAKILTSQRLCLEMNVRRVHIPDHVVEIGERCFAHVKSLSAVTFGPHSRLERLGKSAFTWSGVVEMCIPDSVTDIASECFYSCPHLQRLRFGPNSSLIHIGPRTFYGSSIRDIAIPDGITKLPSWCFYTCESFSSVSFGKKSSLRKISEKAFCETGLEEIEIPDGVVEIGEECFGGCFNLKRVIFSRASSLAAIERIAFKNTPLAMINLPDSLSYLGGSVFHFSSSVFATFGRCLSLSFDLFAFRSSEIREVIIPDCVAEIPRECFDYCHSLSRVVFGRFSSVARLDYRAFHATSLDHIAIPESVVEIGGGCFRKCERLESVRFSPCSSLVAIGARAFSRTALSQFSLPDTVVVVGDLCFSRCALLEVLSIGPDSCLEDLAGDAFVDCPNLSIDAPVQSTTSSLLRSEQLGANYHRRSAKVTGTGITLTQDACKNAV